MSLKKHSFFAFFLTICLSLSIHAQAIISVPFDIAMQRSRGYDQGFANHHGHWQLIRSLFDTYIQKPTVRPPLLAWPAVPLTQDYCIRPMIHFIWLGSPLPARCKPMIDSWKKMHPDWEVKLWTDQDVKKFRMVNQKAFDRAVNFGEKSDIWRYEILYRYGGLYVDTDFECLQPFDELHKTLEFYTGIAYDLEPVLFNGLIGSRPGHPILKACIDSLKTTNPDDCSQRIMSETGPYFFTKAFMGVVSQEKDVHGKIVAFPTTYLYPMPNTEYGMDPEVAKKNWTRPESYALHYWAVSWRR